MSLIITRNTKGSLLTPAQGDDQIAQSTRYLSGALTLSSTHNREVLECNGTFAITLPDAATLQTSLHESANYGDIGFNVTVVNVGTGVITVDLTTAADTLAGVANGTHTLAPERSMTLVLNSNGGTADGYIVPAPSSGGVFSNNANGNPTISDTSADLVALLAAGVYTSFGPTGSGATEIWTALDSVPGGVDWVEISIVANIFLTGSSVNITVLARRTGDTSTDAGPQTLMNCTESDDTINLKTPKFSERGCKIPVDSSGRFDISHTSDGNGPISHTNIYVTGYGWN